MKIFMTLVSVYLVSSIIHINASEFIAPQTFFVSDLNPENDKMTKGIRKYTLPLNCEELPEPKNVGEKAFHLMVLHYLGINIPQGFLIKPDFYNKQYLKTGNISKILWKDILYELNLLEKTAKKKFGDSHDPLFLIGRSNAAEEESMPGVLESIPNIGINDITVHAMAKNTNERFAYDSYCRLMENFGEIVFDLDKKRFLDIKASLMEEYSVQDESKFRAKHFKVLIERYKAMIL